MTRAVNGHGCNVGVELNRRLRRRAGTGGNVRALGRGLLPQLSSAHGGNCPPPLPNVH